jgi:hypothetical protein
MLCVLAFICCSSPSESHSPTMGRVFPKNTISFVDGGGGTSAEGGITAGGGITVEGSRISGGVTSGDGTFSLDDSSRLNHLYDSLSLDSLGLSMEAFHTAVSGFLNLVISGAVRNPGILSIIDFSLPSNQKRLFIVDLFGGRLLFNSLVAHGRNSGGLVPNRFSNRCNSLMSSLGFYLTGESFIGQHGYSLRLEGEEKGWNDNAMRRAIIMHSADYVSEEHIRQWGFLGRSEGCPAIPEELGRPIIDVIQGGSCLFVYSPDKKYLKRSKIG